MAVRCRKTPQCIWFNNPGTRRLEPWLKQTALCSMIDMVATSVETHCDTELERQLGTQLRGAVDAGFACLKGYDIAGDILDADYYGHRLVTIACRLYGASSSDKMKDVQTEAGPVAEAYRHLCADMLERCTPAWERDGLPDMTEHWITLESLLTQMAELWTTEHEPQNPSWEQIYAAFHKALLGEDAVQVPPTLYELRDHTLCVAHGRLELRKMLRDKGMDCTGKISGINAGEVFADGSTAAELVAQWEAYSPCVIGVSA